MAGLVSQADIDGLAGESAAKFADLHQRALQLFEVERRLKKSTQALAERRREIRAALVEKLAEKALSDESADLDKEVKKLKAELAKVSEALKDEVLTQAGLTRLSQKLDQQCDRFWDDHARTKEFQKANAQIFFIEERVFAQLFSFAAYPAHREVGPGRYLIDLEVGRTGQVSGRAKAERAVAPGDLQLRGRILTDGTVDIYCRPDISDLKSPGEYRVLGCIKPDEIDLKIEANTPSCPPGSFRLKMKAGEDCVAEGLLGTWDSPGSYRVLGGVVERKASPPEPEAVKAEEPAPEASGEMPAETVPAEPEALSHLPG